MPSPAAQPDDGEHPYRLNVVDPVQRKTRPLARESDTCIFKPGNRMHPNPGRLKQPVTEARGEARYIICHSSLPCAGSPAPYPDDQRHPAVVPTGRGNAGTRHRPRR